MMQRIYLQLDGRLHLKHNINVTAKVVMTTTLALIKDITIKYSLTLSRKSQLGQDTNKHTSSYKLPRMSMVKLMGGRNHSYPMYLFGTDT